MEITRHKPKEVVTKLRQFQVLSLEPEVTQRRKPKCPSGKDQIVAGVIKLTQRHGHYRLHNSLGGG